MDARPPALASFPRLYAILDLDLAQARGYDPRALLSAWLAAGVRLIQLRGKRRSFGELQAHADRMAADCRAAGATFIVNDRADVARLAGAAGVHLGQADLSVGEARRILGADGIVGLSTHSEAQLSRALGEAVSYVAIGPVYPTQTKTNADAVVGLPGVRSAAARMAASGLPLVAIGGITIDTAPAVLSAGATSVAVVSGLLPETDGDPVARAWVRRLG